MTKSLGESPSVEAPRRVLPRSYYVQKAKAFLALTKPLQTLLLLITGVCAYALSLPGSVRWEGLIGTGVALAGSIAGCTALNMIFDRDIDAQMDRTLRRPLPAGLVPLRSAALFGLLLSAGGLILAWAMAPLFGLIVTLGFAIDLGVYTLWLKRRTPFSILWGGISGGMPALAGRVLAAGRVDLVGLLLAAGVLLWIPAHILTLSTHYAREYHLAGVPVWPNVYGPTATRRLVAGATLLDAAVLALAGMLLSIHPVALGILGIMGALLSGLSVAALIRPSEGLNWRLFKFASLYMLGAFICLTIGAVV